MIPDQQGSPTSKPGIGGLAGRGAPGRATLGWRVAGWIAAIFLLFGILALLIVRETTRRQFRAVERTNLLDRTRQAFLAFDRDASALRTITASIAAWRDTYEFSFRPTEGYLERNFGGGWPGIYGVDFVLIVGVDGRRIWSSDGHPAFPLKGPGHFAPLRFNTDDPFIFPRGSRPKPAESFIRLAESGGTTWIYCAHAITSDDLKETPRGMLLFGRIVDKNRLTSLAFGPQDDLSLVPLEMVPPASEDDDLVMVREFAGYGTSRTAIRREGAAVVSYSPVSDAAGQPAGALRLSVLRKVEAAGNRMVWLMSASLLAVGVVSFGATLVAMRLVVVRPISRLASYFTAHAEGREEVLEVDARRGDEIGVLAQRATALMEKVKEQRAELEDQANTDRLTGLPNRRRFESHIGKELHRILRQRRGSASRNQMAVALIDVDHFKLYNDRYGHMAGDACLRTVAEALRSCAQRPGDLPCRFGGEEFILVMPDTDEQGALTVGESLRAAVQGMAIPHASSPVEPVVTISVGVAAVEVDEGFSLAALIEHADQALYAAKRGGRNRVLGASAS